MTELPVKNPIRYHVPCVILLDKSGSMDDHGLLIDTEVRPIDALNAALADFREMFDDKENADYSVIDICIIAFGGRGQNGLAPDIEMLQNFAPANEMFYTEPLIAYGGTPLALAVETGLKEIDRIKERYTKEEVNYYRPWLVCITDGESTEDETYYNSVKEALHKAVKERHVIPYSIGIGEGIGAGGACNYKRLKEFFGERNTYRLEDIDNAGKFKELMHFLGNSLIARSRSNGAGANTEMPAAVDDTGEPLLRSVTFSAD